MTNHPSSQSHDDISAESLLGQVADEFVERLDRGERVGIEEYAERYPQIASEIRQVLPALAVMQPADENAEPVCDGSVQETHLSGTLGDFRIIREVGRGGMGIVYEAEQLSIGRRVALKVLPFATMLDPKQLQRFKNEVHATGQLHHTNIVPVFSVGCERGVHFYAMQYIEGQTLADVIRQLRYDAGLEEVNGERLAVSGKEAEVSGIDHRSPPTAHRLPSSTSPLAALSTERSTKNPAYFRTVAQLGIQAAEALDHAHQVGIVHRDIKPSNLLLDVRGNLWITDFGLARFQADPSLTMTGDLVGTLRYMSPEQASAKRIAVDHRTDIYSLGMTLYELFTLEPAFDGHNRAVVLRQIAFDEPAPVRRLNHRIPPELETIVLKAMEKDPGSRYATAQELADDLRRFLDHKPIKAKPPTVIERAAKWFRRHRLLAWSAGVGLLVSVVLLSISSLLLWHEKERVKLVLAEKERERQLAEQETAVAEQQRRRAEANFGKALSGMTGLLEELNARRWPHVPEITAVRQALEDQMTGFFAGFMDENSADPVTRMETGWAYQHMGLFYLRQGNHARAEPALRTALAIHEDLATHYAQDPAHIKLFAQSADRLGFFLYSTGRCQEVRSLFERAVEQYRIQLAMQPDWVAHNDLAWFLVTCPDLDMRNPGEAIQIASRALELEPQSVDCMESLAIAHYRNGNWQAAISNLEDCARLARNDSSHYPCLCFFLAMAHCQLGNKDNAQQYYERGVEWMKQRNPERSGFRVRQFQTEAAELLGISDDEMKSEKN